MSGRVTAIAKGCSEILFLNSAAAGVLLLALCLLHPGAALGGAVALVAAFAMALLTGMDRATLEKGVYIYNPLLTGMAAGCLFPLSPTGVALAACAGALVFVLTTALAAAFHTHFALPVLSLPFALAAMLMYLASPWLVGLHGVGLYPAGLAMPDISMPLWLAGFFKSLGAIVFMPYVLPGLLMAALLASRSRILLLLAVAGYYAGTFLTGLFIGSLPIAFADTTHFNYILIAMAVGGAFVLPSPRGYAIALTAVAASAIFLKAIQVFLYSYGIPAFTLPFNVIAISFVYVLGVTRYPHRPVLVKSTPEETLEHHLAVAVRHPAAERAIRLPFSGPWTVWQGFDGKWTHQGLWKYAYDFVVYDEAGRTYANGGATVSDYYAWRKNVLSPAGGVVAHVVDALPDNPAGLTDAANPWGNLVVIYDDRGFYVEVSHFAQHSIVVRPGQRVASGDLLGKCGNSGNSPQPHIHVQVQAVATPGAATLPFCFADYIQNRRYHATGRPAVAAAPEPLVAGQQLDAAAAFVLDQRFEFQLLRNGKARGTWSAHVAMATDGTLCLDSGRGRLYFTRTPCSFLALHVEGDDPVLHHMLCALPRMPLAYRPGLNWGDALPPGAAFRGLRRQLVLLLASVFPQLARVRCTYSFTDRTHITGRVKSSAAGVNVRTEIELDNGPGIRSLRCGDFELRRISHEKNHDVDSDSAVLGHGVPGVHSQTHVCHDVHGSHDLQGLAV